MSAAPDRSGLINRNIYIRNRRTGMRLDDVTWTALREVALREGITPQQLFARIDSRRPADLSFTVAVRQYLLQYFRAAATEDGHAEAGHGMITVPRSMLYAKVA
ncbi:MAG: ribbon-helix-helix domain-containing protein [Acidobacteria bacterium]|nr:ribbon-helix-helix domain-containing protein [Acidobacteriota bacterium]